MKIIKIEQEHINQVTEIAYNMYLSECKYTINITKYEKENIHKRIEDAVTDLHGYVYIEQEEVLGYHIFDESRNELNQICCMTPPWGYGAIGKHREYILSRLFQQLAKELCIKEKVHFEIKLYAHDDDIIRLFSYLQFGIQCEEGICSTDKDIIVTTKTEIRELAKQEIEKRWSEIWSLLSSLIRHLKESPVFYPGNEFTEELYKDFFMDSSTQVYIAMKNNRIIGLIESNSEQNGFIGDKNISYNVGEVYVIDEYRGQGVAQSLLNHVRNSLKTQGVDYLWVEHGTANPNARGFWNKYFNTYCYTMIRDI